jgi:hypothetical protein
VILRRSFDSVLFVFAALCTRNDRVLSAKDGAPEGTLSGIRRSLVGAEASQYAPRSYGQTHVICALLHFLSLSNTPALRGLKDFGDALCARNAGDAGVITITITIHGRKKRGLNPRPDHLARCALIRPQMPTCCFHFCGVRTGESQGEKKGKIWGIR